MNAIMAAKIAGCAQIIAVGGNPESPELAKETGATHTVNRKEVEDVVAEVKKISNGDAVPKAFIPQLLDYYRRGQFPFDCFVKFYPFSEINKAFEESHSGVCIKEILKMDE